MRKRVFGKKLKRTANQRKGLLRSLARSIIIYGRIKTTEAKAKAVRGKIEKLVTRGKENTDHARREILKFVLDPMLADRLMQDIAPKFDGRPGGYTRIIKVGNRLKDNSPMVYLEWVETIGLKSLESKVQNDKVKKEVAKTKTNKAELKVTEKKESKKISKAKKAEKK